MLANSSSEVALDTCLDEFLAGRDWNAGLGPNTDIAELLPLMEVAELLREVAKRTPPMEEPRQQRLFGRMREWLRPTVARPVGGEMGAVRDMGLAQH